MSNTLFVGDLASSCTLPDVEALFSQHGIIRDIRLKRDELTQKRLSYGFVEFANAKQAESAARSLNGHVLRGRALRVSLALPKTSPTEAKIIKTAENSHLTGNTKSSIHIVFITVALPGRVVTEEILRDLFSQFGVLVDVVVKKSNTSHGFNSKGYAFIHFADTVAGAESAMKAVHKFNDVTIDNVRYMCSTSKCFDSSRLNNDSGHIVNTVSMDSQATTEDNKIGLANGNSCKTNAQSTTLQSSPTRGITDYPSPPLPGYAYVHSPQTHHNHVAYTAPNQPYFVPPTSLYMHAPQPYQMVNHTPLQQEYQHMQQQQHHQQQYQYKTQQQQQQKLYSGQQLQYYEYSDNIVNTAAPMGQQVQQQVQFANNQQQLYYATQNNMSHPQYMAQQGVYYGTYMNPVYYA